MFIFLDKSGQFTKHNHDEYFVVGTFSVGKHSRTNKEFKKWIRSKFPRKMCKQNEVKWSSTKISDDLRLKTLKYIASLDVRVRFGFLLRKNIPSKYRRRGKIDSGNLYTNIIAEILEGYLPANDKEIHIFCDQRSLKGMTKKEFEIKIRAHLLPFCPPDTFIQVEMIDSTANMNIQIADWISGALARYLEKRKLGDECYNILRNNFLDEGKEFFKS